MLWFHSFIYSFPSSTYSRDCLFSIVYSCLFYCRLIHHRCMGLFLGFLFCYIDLYFCCCASTIWIDKEDVIHTHTHTHTHTQLPRWLSGKESVCQCRRRRSHPWVRKISWRRKWQPTQVLLPGESQGCGSLGLPPMGLHRVRHDWSDLAAWC